MKVTKLKRGRRRKRAGDVGFGDFVRAGIVMSIYDQARQSSEKHSAAVREAVEFVKNRFPEMRISETGVKRILAAFRPRKSRTILRFERSALTQEEIEKFCWVREFAVAARPEQSSGASLPAVVQSFKPTTKYMIRFAERPNYPRHNRKD